MANDDSKPLNTHFIGINCNNFSEQSLLEDRRVTQMNSLNSTYIRVNKTLIRKRKLQLKKKS